MISATKTDSSSSSAPAGSSSASSSATSEDLCANKVAEASFAKAREAVMEFPLGKPIEESAKDIEFQEFARRLSKQQQVTIRIQWFKISNVREVASHLAGIARSGEAVFEAYRDPEFIELARHPGFDAFVLYAMSSKMPEEERLGVMDASALLCYSQALKTFGEVSVHDDSEFKERFNFFSKGLPADLPKQQRIFFSVSKEAYNRTRMYNGKIDTSDGDGILERLAEDANAPIFSLDPAFILPPAFQQGLADANSSEKVKIRPVLGLSAPEDFRNFWIRDVCVPSSFGAPKEADGRRIPHSTAFYRHDSYHFIFDALNVNLAEYQQLHRIFEQEAKINPSPTMEIFADVCLDREFRYRLFFNDLFLATPPEGIEAFKEACFFLDVELAVSLVKEEYRDEIFPILAKAIPEKFSLKRAQQHPMFQKALESKESLETFCTKLDALL